MSNYHEPADELSQEARNFSRALNSLKEEIEAVDWYHQRVVTSNDPELADIMAHNRDEEIEHACMTLEWLRRHMPGWDAELRTYLFKEGSITGHEGVATGKPGVANEASGSQPSQSDTDSLGLGKLGK